MEKKLVIYTSNTCAYCEMAKEYFKNKGLSYEERNISDPEHRKFLMKLGVRGVPTIMVGDKHVVGFDQEQVDELLKDLNDSEDASVKNEKDFVKMKEDNIETVPITGNGTVAKEAAKINEGKIEQGIKDKEDEIKVGCREDGECVDPAVLTNPEKVIGQQ